MEEEPFDFPIDGVLDLHTFQPRDVKGLLSHYLAVCMDKGIFQVRIIHGKGSGALRETVHSLLKKLPEVVSFSLAGEDAGGWGATIAVLKNQASENIPTKKD
ncbi:MAG: Smr/MutS family protein [Nitrospirae bacterium]|nr:Smr/MutS family protein [Nitrospirota bacterium]